MTEVRAIRLEALPDPSLPRQGPGRHALGNFQLNAFRVFASQGVNGEPSDRIQLADAWASYEYPYHDVAIRGTIDDRDPRMWHVFSRSGERHIAVFELATPWRVEPGQTLIVQCGYRDAEGGINLGRFRLSVSNDPRVMETERQRWTLAENGDPWSRLGAAYAAVGDSARAAEWFARSLDRTPGFAARRGLVERIDRLLADLSALLALRPDDPLLLKALAKRRAEAGQTEAAAESFARARSLTEEMLGDTRDWTVLEPIEVNGEAGETLTVESDGSIFVSGPNPERAIYTLALPLNGRPVNAIRLETLPDARLPHGGAGRYAESGNFHLSEFKAALVIGDDGKSIPIPIVSAIDDYHYGPDYSAMAALDGSPNTLWDIKPYFQNPHSAVFTFASPIESTDGRLIVRLDSGVTPWGLHGLGRFSSLRHGETTRSGFCC